MKARQLQLATILCAAAAVLLAAFTPALLSAVRARQSASAPPGGASGKTTGSTSKAGVEELPRQSPPRPRMEYLGDWGTRGDGPANLDLAVAIASDALGMVYIADAGSGFIHKFTPSGHPLLAFDDPRVTNPVAIAVDSDGEIYTVDGRSGRVFVFSSLGDPDHEQHAGTLVRFRAPSAVAVDPDQDLYVADTGLEAVALYDSRGRFVRAVARGSTGSTRVHTPVALVAAPDGSLAVADGTSGLIYRFSPHGDFLGTLGQASSPLRTKNPVSLAASDNFLFCFDAAPPRLLVWTLDGKPYFEQDLSARIALSSGSSDTRASLTFAVPDLLLLLDPSSGKVLRFRLFF
ncbi:MAG TPA: NHL repeat-containing protein [Candidatus Acidoferrales bacterium]|nr:NHL repeat-containing protein [Candidatus Acidoferrales bacterium]